jgi:hypothetical protein
MNKIKKILADIDEGKSINLNTLTSCIKQYGLYEGDLHDAIYGTSLAPQAFKVSGMTQELRDSLDKYAIHNDDDKASAAIQNRSHRVKMDSALMICRFGTQHPFVITIDDLGQFNTPVPIDTTNVIIIENQTNFMTIEQTQSFLHNYCGVDKVTCKDALYIWGMGNQISHKLKVSFLSTFTQLYLHLDIDLGGLQIASNLIGSLPQHNVMFILPDDIYQRLDNVAKPLSDNEIDGIVTIGRRHSALSAAATAMKDSRRGIEQESFLYGR